VVLVVTEILEIFRVSICFRLQMERGRELSALHSAQTALGAHPTCSSVDNGNFCIGGKQVVCEAGHAFVIPSHRMIGAVLSLPHMPSRHVH
jgi:hypothetical protein